MGLNLTARIPAELVGALALLLSSPFAAAQTVSDLQSGLAVKPQGRAGPRALHGRHRSKRDSERDTGCKVAFHPIEQNSGLNQAQINALVDTPERRAVIEGPCAPARGALPPIRRSGPIGRFLHTVDQVLPRRGDTLPLPFGESDSDDEAAN